MGECIGYSFVNCDHIPESMSYLSLNFPISKEIWLRKCMLCSIDPSHSSDYTQSFDKLVGDGCVRRLQRGPWACSLFIHMQFVSLVVASEHMKEIQEPLGDGCLLLTDWLTRRWIRKLYACISAHYSTSAEILASIHLGKIILPLYAIQVCRMLIEVAISS